MATRWNSRKANLSYGQASSCMYMLFGLWSELIMLDERYILLTTIQTLYAFFVEGNVVFVGKRKTFDKRVCRPIPLSSLH